MTASVVAVVTDVIRDGKPVVGYGFNSNGRYAASGLLNERFLPRLREADPESLMNEAGDLPKTADRPSTQGITSDRYCSTPVLAWAMILPSCFPRRLRLPSHWPADPVRL